MRRIVRVMVVVSVAAFVLWLLLPAAGPRIEEGSILSVDLSGGFVEAAAPSLPERLLGDERRPFVSVLSELRKAERDSRLGGVVLRIRRLATDWGMAQELRLAIRDLRDAGVPTVAFLETGALGANLEYYVASAAERVVVSPGTSSPLVGLGLEFYFFGGLWEKLGAGFDAIGSGEYKSAAETIAGREMSPAHREMAESILDSIWGQLVADVAEARGLEPAEVRRAIDLAPVDPEKLRDTGLVDEVAHFDHAVASLGDGPLIEGRDFAGVRLDEVDFEPEARVALVYGSGTVVMGEGTRSPLGGLVLTSDSVSDALLRASEADDIDAIVFRVDSPGGSPLASDLIWRALERAKQAGKPIVASVSNVAASGGYYVLCGADEVVATPGSLVGSIGVFVVRPTLRGLFDELDIGVETMKRGRYGDLLLSSEPLSDDGRYRLRAEIDALYDLFLGRVAEGRGLTRDEVHALGRGRVWTGAQAAERGLVSRLGGLRVAVDAARERLGLAADADVEIVPFPPPPSLVDQLAEALQGAALRASSPLRLPLPWIDLGPYAELLGAEGPLLVPPVLFRIR